MRISSFVVEVLSSICRRGSFFLICLLVLSSFEVSSQISSNVDSLLTVSKTLSDSQEKVKIYLHIGHNYAKKHPESAFDYLHRAVSLGKKLDEKKYSSSTYSQLALLHNRMGNRDSSGYYLGLCP